jgi:hypothetical protein
MTARASERNENDVTAVLRGRSGAQPSAVIAGLAPAIQLFLKKRMDPRVKPGGDA